MGAAQAVPKHLGQRQEPFAAHVLRRDTGEFWHIIGNGEDLPQRQRCHIEVTTGEPHHARRRQINGLVTIEAHVMVPSREKPETRRPEVLVSGFWFLLFAQTDGSDIVRSVRDRLKIEFGDGEFLVGER